MSDLAWNLAPLQDVAPAVADLVHIAAGAYMADRSTRRGARFSRDIALHVTVVAPELWTEELLDTTSELLGWLTGDTWNLTVAGGAEVDFEETLKVGDNGSVALLSGGLDSFLGAIQLLMSGAETIFVGHKDTATSIRGAQSTVGTWLGQSFAPALHASPTRTSNRRRGRAVAAGLMFLSRASLSRAVWFTELDHRGTQNQSPLRPNRGGALSTHSTHPETPGVSQRF
ncbi:MAG: hypothetical protein LC118_15655 [Dehalococcoidia bacterium]|nr:hypothetical protein [Dehalococcoidia bacterium]